MFSEIPSVSEAFLRIFLNCLRISFCPLVSVVSVIFESACVDKRIVCTSCLKSVDFEGGYEFISCLSAFLWRGLLSRMFFLFMAAESLSIPIAYPPV